METVKSLSREQAINRINELGNFEKTGHLSGMSYDTCGASDAIIDELKHIFGIKEEELK